MGDSIGSYIRVVPDFPRKGILFRDITTLVRNRVGLKLCVDDFYGKYKDEKIDHVVGIDSRGFIIGGALAYLLGVGFLPVRKKGKLPGEIETQEYDLEYGSDVLEISRDAIQKGDRVVIVDDLIATGGTVLATIDLIERLGGTVVSCGFVVTLNDVGGVEKLREKGVSFYSQVSY